MAASIQIFGHSFVSRLKSFLRNEPHLHFNLNLTSLPLVQYSGYSGAKVETLRRNFTDITDFAPDIVVLLIGTNDLCQPDVDHVSVSAAILDLIDSLLFLGNVKRVICCQILHRRPSQSTHHHVDTTWFNNRVDETNYILSTNIQALPHGRATFWRLKGFWSPEAQSQVFALDGVHLSVMGQKKLYSNIRAAVVATLNNGLEI
ncbi:uncharacterized protein LOC132736397 [Ruditapes philippinarum]|uniref:uncharacterized protein LOC132736397 n=1 Tax=Ruditapes philippinarum TaxID=129788 RepID=UPI00295C2B69|nr:uncharacterized protein LOC132736397 [Ruditapes philippinarum]